MKLLAEVFVIYFYAYAVMSNRYHVILLVDIQTAHDWTEAATYGVRITTKWQIP